MSPTFKVLINIFKTGLVNPQAMAAVLLAGYQASKITWSEALEIAKQMDISLG